ncbi:hypothetical protein NDU88_008272 [Pleurodeles waltl]|uniref:Uncharacterized protein n=1 Tax=Pleurodeles waltl TaxID=8319 RepID=A0AAV7PR58_PLEWA|nr:hypothetical protein NDU88_008272 [Pleurodeles waltl]
MRGPPGRVVFLCVICPKRGPPQGYAAQVRDPPGVRLVLAGTLGLVLGAWFKAVPGSRRAVGAVTRGAGACLRCIGRAFGAGSKAQLSLGSRRAGSAVPQAEPPALRESRERPTFAFPGNRRGRPGNLVLGLLAGRVRGRVAAAVRSPASSGQRGGVSLSARRSEDTGRHVLARLLCSGPRLGFRSGHSELPVVAGLRPDMSYSLHKTGECFVQHRVQVEAEMEFPSEVLGLGTAFLGFHITQTHLSWASAANSALISTRQTGFVGSRLNSSVTSV